MLGKKVGIDLGTTTTRIIVKGEGMIGSEPTAVAIRGGEVHAATFGAAALEAAGCRYQWARTLVFIGGEQRAHGESMLATMGATPMVWPPE